jgi:hypothetical protein
LDWGMGCLRVEICSPPMGAKVDEVYPLMAQPTTETDKVNPLSC